MPSSRSWQNPTWWATLQGGRYPLCHFVAACRVHSCSECCSCGTPGHFAASGPGSDSWAGNFCFLTCCFSKHVCVRGLIHWIKFKNLIADWGLLLLPNRFSALAWPASLQMLSGAASWKQMSFLQSKKDSMRSRSKIVYINETRSWCGCCYWIVLSKNCCKLYRLLQLSMLIAC